MCRDQLARRLAAATLLAAIAACDDRRTAAPVATPSSQAVAAASPSILGVAPGDAAIRFLERRVKDDPDDFMALNQLAARYLQRVRETGAVNFLDLATRAARASLAAMPEAQNLAGLAILAQTEQASHQFTAARDHARRLIELAPGRSDPYAILGDALVEFGDYDAATRVYEQMQQAVERAGASPIDLHTRLGQLAWLRGDVEAASRSFSAALDAARETGAGSETIAWCQWRLGELAFAQGDYPGAEGHYRDALATVPDYYRAVAGLGRARAARGDLEGAIALYEHVITILPEPAFVATLGDLYELAGRHHDAAAQYELVGQIGILGAAGGNLFDRQLALFYADHDRELERAHALAAGEYAVRRDVYGADAVAWTSLKLGKVAEAQTAMRDALRLGTLDPRLLYHAGMIATAAGDRAQGRDYLDRALRLSPSFDPMQARLAQQARNGSADNSHSG